MLSKAGSDTERGIVVMVLAVLVAPGAHATAKLLGSSLSAGEIALARFLVQAIVLLPVVLVVCKGRIPSPRLTHVLRGVLLATATLFFFWSLKRMPLADASAIYFVQPLILTLMSAFFLGEKIGFRRILGVVIGLAGALMVIRPSFEAVGFAALLPLVSALCIAIYFTMTRSLSKNENPRVLQFWACIFASLVLFPALVAGAHFSIPVLTPSWPQGVEWGLLALVGIIGMTSHMLAIKALHMAPAGVLAPFQYLEILGATLLGFVVFSDVPDLYTFTGILIIVGSGLYVFHRERAVQRESGS